MRLWDHGITPDRGDSHAFTSAYCRYSFQSFFDPGRMKGWAGLTYMGVQPGYVIDFNGNLEDWKPYLVCGWSKFVGTAVVGIAAVGIAAAISFTYLLYWFHSRWAGWTEQSSIWARCVLQESPAIAMKMMMTVLRELKWRAIDIYRHYCWSAMDLRSSVNCLRKSWTSWQHSNSPPTIRLTVSSGSNSSSLHILIDLFKI